MVVFYSCKKNNTPTPAMTYPVYDYDGNGYDTVNIHGQTWLVQNLRVKHYRNGNPIRNLKDSASWIDTYLDAQNKRDSGAWCHYDNKPAYEDIGYGALYNFYAVQDPRGLSPEGWHVATKADWDSLIAHLGGKAVAGDSLKSTTTWSNPHTNATNSSGFTALPAGIRDIKANFHDLTLQTIYWSSTKYYTRIGTVVVDQYAIRSIDSFININSGIIGPENPLSTGLSVRCVKNN